jgi:hypothetical protein
VNRTAAQLDLIRKGLLQLPIGDGLQADVSPAAQQKIAAMKTAIGSFISAYVLCVPAQPDAGKINQDLSALGHAYEMPTGITPIEKIPPDFGKYGFELWFKTRVFENPPLLGIVAGFSIECGGDTVLLLFAPNGGSWKEVLRWQKEPYATVAGGTMAFDYGVSPPDDYGHWFLITHDIAPWCSSTWSEIRYSVLRSAANPIRPKTLFSADDPMWWGNEDYGSLTVEKEGFDLRFHSASIDGGVHDRVRIRHFSVVGDAVYRTQPVADSPRDFVDEWIVSPWQEAAEWSSHPALSELGKSHAEWSKRKESKHKLLEYYSMRRCSNGPDHYQVEMGLETGPKFGASRSFYFQVQGGAVYTMLRVSEKPDTTCSGPNLLALDHEVE